MLVVAHVIRVVGPRVGRQEELNNEKVMGRTAATRVEGRRSGEYVMMSKFLGSASWGEPPYSTLEQGASPQIRYHISPS